MSEDTFDPGPHCGRIGCRCLHDCEKGWVWETRTDSHGRTTDAVVACATCDPERNLLQRQAPNRARLQEALRNRSLLGRAARARKREADETSIL